MSFARFGGAKEQPEFRQWLQGISLLVMIALVAGCSATSKLTKKSPRFLPFSEIEKESLEKEGYEAPPVLDAKSVLPSELYSGPYHKVEAEVLNDGFCNRYRIISKFGVFDVTSTEMLKIRVDELQKISEIKKVSKAGVVVQSIGKGAMDIALAPLRSLQSVFKIVSNPKKTLNTVTSIPAGIEHAAGKATSALKKDKKENDSVANEEEIVPVMGPEDRGGLAAQDDNIAARYIQNRSGFGKRAKEWQRKMGINPYSTNEVLHKELENIVLLDTTVGIALKFAPGIYGAIPGMSIVGNINKYYGQAEKISVYEDPESIEVKNRVIYQDLGIPERTIGNLGKNGWYSPIDRANLLQALAKMKGVEGLDVYIRVAMRADSEEKVISFVKAAQYFAFLHNGKQKIKRFVGGVGLPTALAASGRAVVVWPVGDYIAWTKGVAGSVKDIAAAIGKTNPGMPVDFYALGEASPRMKKELAGFGGRFIKINAGDVKNSLQNANNLLAKK